MRGARYISHSDLVEKYNFIKGRIRLAVADTEKDDDNDDVDNEQELINSIALINKEIQKYGFRIERKHDQNEELTLFYMYTNILGDEIMKKDTRYSVNELQAIKQVIDLIVESPSLKYSVPKQEAVRAISADTKRLLDLSDTFLSHLVEDGWFIIKSARVKLSIRSLSELKSYLLDRYALMSEFQDGSLVSCPVCNELVTEGFFCSQCRLGYHRKCDSINKQGSDVAVGCCNQGHGEFSLIG